MCLGALDRIDEAKERFSEVFDLVRKKNNQIEQFVMRRVSRFNDESERKKSLMFFLLIECPVGPRNVALEWKRFASFCCFSGGETEEDTNHSGILRTFVTRSPLPLEYSANVHAGKSQEDVGR